MVTPRVTIYFKISEGQQLDTSTFIKIDEDLALISRLLLGRHTVLRDIGTFSLLREDEEIV